MYDPKKYKKFIWYQTDYETEYTIEEFISVLEQSRYTLTYYYNEITIPDPISTVMNLYDLELIELENYEFLFSMYEKRTVETK